MIRLINQIPLVHIGFLKKRNDSISDVVAIM